MLALRMDVGLSKSLRKLSETPVTLSINFGRDLKKSIAYLL